MADYDYDFCFRGVDREECSNFIRQVRRKAFEAGKSRDKEWMADYAVSCFADDALEWSVEAPSNVLENWDVLQRALMEEYCKHSIPSAGLSGAAAPTPAAAPAPSPGTTLPTNTSTMTGYIRIVAETPEAGNYISKTVDPEFGVLVTCTDIEAAARVKLIPLMSSYGVQLLDFPGPYCWLGILGCFLEEGGRIGPESRGNLCPVSAPTSHVMGTSVTELEGPARSNIWIFQAVDSCIVSIWKDSTFTYVLEPLINLGNKRILAVSNCLKYSAKWPDTKYAKARLIFEPA